MKRSTTFRRVLLLAYSAVVGFALLILSIWNLTSPRIFAANKIDDLVPKGQIIAQFIESTMNGEISSSYLLSLIGQSTTQWEATVWVVDSQGDTLIRTQMIDGRRVGRLPEKLSRSMLPKVLSGELSTHIGTMDDLVFEDTALSPARRNSLLDRLAEGQREAELSEEVISGGLVAVAVPIRYMGQVIGAVFMAESMSEVISGMRAISNTVMISLLAVSLFLLPLVMYFASRMVRPLNQMRAVAMTMAAGDRAIRADESNPDEYGELGHALNHLSSELGQTIASLQRERNRLQSLINGLSEGIIALDSSGSAPLLNPAVYRLLELPQGGANLLKNAPEVYALLSEVLRTGENAQETFWRGQLALHISVSVLSDGAGCVAILSDVTSAERLEQTRRDYVANVSHELRTPLTALRALVEPLRDGLVTTEQQRQQIYDVVLRETMRLSRLVSDMLELSRLQSGSASLQRSVFSPSPLFALLRDTFAPYAEDMQQQFLFDVPETLPSVVGNPDRTQQVLTALLDNAFKYTPENGTVCLRVEVQPSQLLVSVQDNGVGIGPDDLPHVFDRFYQVDKSHHSQGTGLGLAIAYEIMRQLGEELNVSSILGQGATFSFTLHRPQEGEGLPALSAEERESV